MSGARRGDFAQAKSPKNKKMGIREVYAKILNAIQYNNLEDLIFLLKLHPFSQNDLTVVKYNRVDLISVFNGILSRLPIHTAANFEVAQALVAHGTYVDELDGDNQTPLQNYINRYKKRDMWCDDIAKFVEYCDPLPDLNRITPKTDVMFVYFTRLLEKRRINCRRTLLYFIWLNPFIERNIAKRIALVVWKTRRQIIWE